MTGFIAGAIALTLLTLALLVVPLLRRRIAAQGTSQSDASVAVLREQLEELERDRAAGTIDAASYEAAQHNLKLRILEDAVPESAGTADRPHPASAIALLVLLPLAAVGLYGWLGAPDALDPRQARADAQHFDAGQMEAAVERLAQRLQASPDDPEGWSMLARSYRVLGRHADAVVAFERAEKFIAASPERLTEWAESAALVGGGKLAGRPAELVARALTVNPEFPQALALAGAAAFEAKDWQGAIAHWERLARQFAPGSEEAGTVARSLAVAREELARAGGTAAAPAPLAKPAPIAAAPAPATTRDSAPVQSAPKFRLAGTVSLAPALAAKASPEDPVFIFARAAGGPPMPLAVLRKTVKELPLEFTLDDSSAMMAEGKLAAIGEVIVGARVSRSGNAAPQSGDLQGLSRPVRIGATGISVVIDAALP
jgi:cytochrome c-type biogenesis protein CcmH